MKNLILFCVFLISNCVFAQDQLYYFYSKDSIFVGVKNDKGKIIIPARFLGAVVYDTKTPINTPTIELLGSSSPKKQKYHKDNPRIKAGEVYNRKGQLLYYPLLYDNGPDYWEEGLKRYVENDKVGFVNWFGKKVIPARWDFAMPFHYGYAEVYTRGWKKRYIDSEHWDLAPTSKKSTSYIINKKGVRVKPMKKPNTPKDYLYKGKYYPNPFVYNHTEQKIVDKINEFKILKEINTPYDKNAIKHYEIINRPNQYLPYYELKYFSGKDKNNGYNESIWVNKNGEIFHRDYEQNFIPIKKHIINTLNRIIDDQKEGFKTEDYPIKAQKLLQEIKHIDFKIKM